VQEQTECQLVAPRRRRNRRRRRRRRRREKNGAGREGHLEHLEGGLELTVQVVGDGESDPVHAVAGLEVEELLPHLDVGGGVSHLDQQARQLSQHPHVFLFTHIIRTRTHIIRTRTSDMVNTHTHDTQQS
jgi:hypothetical protein